VKPKLPSTRRNTGKRTELRRASHQVARRRVAKDFARQTRLTGAARAPLQGVALVTGVFSLFAFTIAVTFVSVALLVASSWGESPGVRQGVAR
jgi:hypothetical protein